MEAEAQLSLSSFKKHFDDQLTCSVCLDQYANPKTLPCHHSFCLECIQPLPIEIKDGKYYISCPTCRVNHLVPQGGAANLPNAFQINSFLELQRKLITRQQQQKQQQQQQTSSTTCPKHNDPLKAYCETCCQVICCECTISEEHNTHNFHLISKCYPKHHQKIQENLDLLKHKTADIDTAMTDLATREREVLQQGQQLKEQINTHAQQIIDQVQRSREHLSQQVDTIVQQKTQELTEQRQQAQKLHSQLKTCQEMIECNLKEWTKQQILTEKHTMMDQMSTATQHVDPAVLQPREKADIQFVKTDTIEKEIGLITTAPSVKQSSTATLTLQSQDASPLLSILSSQGKSNVAIDKLPHVYAASPFTFPVVPSPWMRDKPVNILSGPRGIAVFDNGDIVVAEVDGHCITILSKEGVKMKSFGTKGIKEGQFTYPHRVAITKDGHILVTDNHRLQKLTTKGVCVKSVGSSTKGSGQLQFNYPEGITVHPTTGQIFVGDSMNHRIQVYNNCLTFSHTISLQGGDCFNWPCATELDNEGYLYVAEYSGHCITKLTTTGQYITRFGFRGSAPGQLSCPSSLTINNNLVYVSEYGNGRVSIFDTTGEFLYCFGKLKYGSEEKDVNEPYWPCGIAIDAFNQKLYVSDSHDNKIVVYQLHNQ